MDIDYINNSGIALSVLSGFKETIKPIIYFFGVYFNFIIMFIIKYIRSSQIQKIKNLNDTLVLLLCALNVNFIEKILFSSVTDYIHLEFLRLYINISDVILTFSVFYMTYLNLRLFIMNKNYYDKRSSLGLSIPFQRKLCRYIFLWSFFIQIPWIILIHNNVVTVGTFDRIAFDFLIILLFSAVNSLFLAILILNLNHHSVGVLYAIKRSFYESSSLDNIKFKVRQIDEHQDLVNDLNSKLEILSRK